MQNTKAVSNVIFAVGLIAVMIICILASSVVTGMFALAPQGEKGDTGATGATGPQGPAGPKGDSGPAGAAGATGATGAQGPKGDTGATGATGATGTQGPAGLGVQPGFLVAPAYDSGWIYQSGTVTLTHGLNTMELFAYVVWRDNTQVGYVTTMGVNAEPYAVQWRITSPNEIELVRTQPWNNMGPVRVLAWRITPP